MDWIIAFFVGLLIGVILGVISLNESEAKKAKAGKHTVFDGDVYKYVKLEDDSEGDWS